MFPNLADDTKIWIYGFSEYLNSQQKKTVIQALDDFVSEWQSHGNSIAGDYKIVEDRFVILAVNENISGCSIDSSVHIFKHLKTHFGLDALNLNLIFYRDNIGKIRSILRSDFANLVKKQEIKKNTPVFNTAFNTLRELRDKGFEAKFSESWHSKVFTY